MSAHADRPRRSILRAAGAIAVAVIATLSTGVASQNPAYAVVPDAVADDIVPAVAHTGRTTTFTVTGVGFTPSTAVEFGAGTTVTALSITSATALSVTVSFAPSATIGTRNVVTRNTGGRATTLTDAIVVRTTAGELHPLTPARLLDTRLGNRRLAPDEARPLTVVGVGGVPATGVAAVVLNVTATEASASTFVTVYPSGPSTRPEASNLNVVPGQTVPNLVTVAVGPDGTVRLYNHSGTVHLVVDVAAWYGTAAAEPGAAFVAMTPVRLLDTRNGTPTPVPPDSAVSVKVAAAGSATAAALNVTITEPTEATYLTVYPADAARPLASNLNAEPGQTHPNMVIVPLSPDGSVRIYNHSGRAHVVVDLLGVFPSDHLPVLGGEFVGTAPVRIVDTRGALGGRNGRPLNPSETAEFTVAGRGGVPADATAVVVNVTATETTAPGYLTVWPAGDDRPTASNLNMAAGDTVPNLVVVPLGPDGSLSVFNWAGTTHVLFDVVGWYV